MIAEIKTLDPNTLKLWLNKNEVILIDVRTALEYKKAHIDKAINIPLSQLSAKIYQLPGLGKKKIVLQCKSGIRSMIGCQTLNNGRFQYSLWNLEGGIHSWSSSGFPIIALK